MATKRHDDIRMCIDRFVPDDQRAAAEASALSERPDNLMAVALDGGRRGPGRQRMAIITNTLWKPGTVVACRFLDGEASVKKRVEAVAHGWEDVANIRLKFVDDADAPVRISFKLEGSWSYMGTVCQQIPKSEPTMNFGWLEDDTDDTEYRRVVVHEFGHAVGLDHSDRLDAAMYGDARFGELGARALASDDVAGVCSIYAPSGDAPSSAGPDPSPIHCESDLAPRSPSCAVNPLGRGRGAAFPGIALVWAFVARRGWRKRTTRPR